MALEMNLPDIGEGLTEAEIVQWLVAVGDGVGANQPIVEVETAKAVVEITATRGGVLLHQGAPAGSTLEVGSLLAVIGEAGETWGTPAAPSAAAARNAVVDEMRTAVGGSAPPAEPSRPVKAVPLVRKLARDPRRRPRGRQRNGTERCHHQGGRARRLRGCGALR